MMYKILHIPTAGYVYRYIDWYSGVFSCVFNTNEEAINHMSDKASMFFSNRAGRIFLSPETIPAISASAFEKHEFEIIEVDDV